MDWLGDYHALMQFLREAEFEISLASEIRLFQVLAVLRQDGVDLSDAPSAARWFSPVLCQSSADQHRLPSLLQDYAAQSRRRDAARSGRPTATSDAPLRSAPETRPVQPANGALKTGFFARVGLRIWSGLRALLTFRWRVGLGLLCLALGLAFVLFLLIQPLPKPNPAAKGNTEAAQPAQPQAQLQPEAAPKPTQRTYQQETLWLAFSLQPLVVAILLILGRRRLKIAVSRQLSADVLPQHFQIEGTGDLIFRQDAVRRFMPSLMAASKRGSAQFDAAASIRRTVRAGGRPVLCWKSRTSRPQYVLVSERISSFDHIGTLGDRVFGWFARYGIPAVHFDYDENLSILRRSGSTRFEPLEKVASAHAGQRLMLIGDGAAMLDRGGAPFRWLQQVLPRFSGSCLLSPVPQTVWAGRESRLRALGMGIFPLDAEGLGAAATGFMSGSWPNQPAMTALGGFQDFFGQLHRERDQWVSDRPPERSEQRDLVVRLRAWLGEPGYILTAALAQFPQVRPELTMVLAKHLQADHRRGVGPYADTIDTATFLEILRLPWLRVGRMPDWCRQALLAALPPASRLRIRALYSGILERLSRSARGQGLRIVAPRRLWQTIADLVGKTSRLSPSERLIWDFSRGRDLDVDLPAGLAKNLRRRLDGSEWLIALFALLLCATSLFYEDRAARAPTLPPAIPLPVPEPVSAAAPPTKQTAVKKSPPPPVPQAAQYRTFLVFFDWQRTDITTRARQIVAEAADSAKYWIQKEPGTIIHVNGFDDLSSSQSVALALSRQRADAIKKDLIADGVSESAIAVLAKGHADPLVPTAPGVHEPQNRRAEIVIGDGSTRPTSSALNNGTNDNAQPVVNPQQGPAPGSEEDLVRNVGDRVFFAKGSATLNADAKTTLTKQSAWLKMNPDVTVQVAGNADDEEHAVKRKSSEEYALALGDRRAQIVRNYLVSLGVQAKRITSISYGKDRPLALGESEDSWAQNRNVITSVR